MGAEEADVKRRAEAGHSLAASLGFGALGCWAALLPPRLPFWRKARVRAGCEQSLMCDDSLHKVWAHASRMDLTGFPGGCIALHSHFCKAAAQRAVFSMTHGLQLDFCTLARSCRCLG